MIEVGREFGIEQDATAYDLTSDEVIGRALVRKVLAQVHALALERDSEFSDFATSFRTMNREDRAEWLHRAALAASNADGGHPDEQRAQKAEDAQTSHDETARQLLEDVAQATTIMMAADAAMDAAAAAARGAATLSGIRTRKVSAATLGLAAGPIGVLAGGAFLHQLRRRSKKSADSQAWSGRRERRSS